MEKPLISLKNVSKDYYIFKSNIKRMIGFSSGRFSSETRHALKNVSLDIHRGEKVIIMGFAGSGCSTLARIMSGITFPTSGTAKIRGSVKEFISPSAGMEMEFTGHDNLYLKGNVYGIPKNELKTYEDEIIDFSQMENFLTLPLKQAPKRILLKMSIGLFEHAPGNIAIVDNSFKSGGIPTRRSCLKSLREYVQANPELTYIMCTNMGAYAQNFCTRGILLDQGEVLFDGSIAEARARFIELRDSRSALPEPEVSDEDTPAKLLEDGDLSESDPMEETDSSDFENRKDDADTIF